MYRSKKSKARLIAAAENIHIMAGLTGIEDVYDSDTGRSILKINPLIHKVVLLGHWKYCKRYRKPINNMFGKLHCDNTFRPGRRMPYYNEKWIRDEKDCKVIIYSSPVENRYYPFRMEIYCRENTTIGAFKDRLIDIGNHMPCVLMWEVEYTLDIHCYDPPSVRDLFDVIRKHFYIPYQTDSYMHGRGEQIMGRKSNSVYRVSAEIKLYERGPDSKKKDKGWNMGDVNRVRLERTANKGILRKNGIRLINDFIDNPMFFEMNKDKYKFKCFTNRKRLPTMGWGYKTPDKNGHQGAFQTEVIKRRDHIRNIHQYMNDIPDFDELIWNLRHAMKMFDRQWQRAAPVEDPHTICHLVSMNYEHQ